MPYCIYLRKSRMDMEAEAQGAGETLSRHQTALLELAKCRELAIEHIYKEIVSGDTIAARPEMQRLLSDVEAGLWEGVLVMEVERLARGDTVDQGLVAQTFKYSGTKIITPVKTYDPDNDMDEEYFEFSLFMSRREYKTIKRRLNAGRLASAKDGNYMGAKTTFGYDKVRVPGRGQRWQLVPNEHAAVVQQIFDWYEHGIDGRKVGAQPIANRVNALGIKTVDGNKFTPDTVRKILHNPTYIGCTTWNKRVSKVSMENGQRKTQRVKCANPVIVYGMHTPIISREQYDEVQRILLSKQNHMPVNLNATLQNPLAGLVVCGVCGRIMVRKPDTAGVRPDALFCPTNACVTSSTYIRVVEEAIVKSLRMIASIGISAGVEGTEPDQPADNNAALLGIASSQLLQLQQQRKRIHEFLERGVYSIDDFVERNTDVTEQIASTEAEIARIKGELRKTKNGYTPEQITRVTNFLETYNADASVQERNQMLKEVIESVTYHKTQRNYRNMPLDTGLSIDIMLKE